jgi:hypothetical protein
MHRIASAGEPGPGNVHRSGIGIDTHVDKRRQLPQQNRPATKKGLDVHLVRRHLTHNRLRNTTSGLSSSVSHVANIAAAGDVVKHDDVGRPGSTRHCRRWSTSAPA